MHHVKRVTKPALAQGPPGHGGPGLGPPGRKTIPETLELVVSGDKFIHHFVEHADDE